MDGVGIVEFEVSVVKRKSLESDLPIIYSTWRNACFYGPVTPHTQPARIFFKKMTVMIKEILDCATTMVACLEDDPDLVIGYAVYTKDHLHWVYVKKDYRNKGIASLLTPKGIKTVDWDLTEVGNDIATKKWGERGRE